MRTNQYKLKVDSNTDIHIYSWLPDNDNDIIATLQIAHGMAEHGERYADFAGFLVNNGFAVYANDHRGHGKTAKSEAEFGYFADKDGWNIVVQDLKTISVHIKEKHSDKPFIVFGHSMGSLLMRNYIMQPPVQIAGAILSGTAGNPGLLGKFGVFLTRLIMLFNKNNSRSNIMNYLSFGTFNKQFKPARTKFDWLSRDNNEVNKYINDPYCGYIFTIKAFNDLLKGTLYVNNQTNIEKTNNKLPICLIAGKNDPVGENGKGVTNVYNAYIKAGLKNVELKLFDNCRHELINETNKQEIYEFVLNQCRKFISK